MTSSSPFPKRTSRPGFTLLELMIVVACLAIIGLMALPSADDRGTRLTAAARQLTADLEYAQASSIGRGDDPCVVVFDAADAGYYLARASDPAVPLTHPVTHGDYLVRFGRGIEYDSISAGADDVLEYSATGALDSGSDAAVTLRCGSATLQVVIDADTGEPATP